MIRSRPARSVTSSRPSGSGSTDQGWSSGFASSTTSNATFDATPQVRVWPGNAGVCSLAFGARVSSGVQFAGSAAGAAAGVDAAVPDAATLLLLAVLVPGLAQAPARRTQRVRRRRGARRSVELEGWSRGDGWVGDEFVDAAVAAIGGPVRSRDLVAVLLRSSRHTVAAASEPVHAVAHSPPPREAMGRTRRIVLAHAGTLLGVLLAGTGVVYARSESMLRRTYAVAQRPIVIPTDSASVARGAHLVNAVGTCATCHGEDLGGRVYADMGPIGIVAGPNLTPGRGGRGAVFRDDDWVRAIRFGTSPGRNHAHCHAERGLHEHERRGPRRGGRLPQTTAAHRPGDAGEPIPPTRPRHARGWKLNILTAPKTPAKSTVASVPVGVTPPYGKYLVEIAGCAGCHGYGLSGGRVAGPPGIPPASNLTPSGIGSWSESDLRRVLREGRRPNGTAIDPFMPWKTYAGMTDDEIAAIWRYLRTVPAKPFGNK
jgi:cytochrome c553